MEARKVRFHLPKLHFSEPSCNFFTSSALMRLMESLFSNVKIPLRASSDQPYSSPSILFAFVPLMDANANSCQAASEEGRGL
jgi:hypothetical protein